MSWFERYIYYPLYRFYDDWINLKTWYYRVERTFQWIIWGFDPKDIWSLDVTTSKWILPRLKKLKETKQGVPGLVWNDKKLLKHYELKYGKLNIDITNDEDDFKANEILWNFVMDMMINSFELIDHNFDYEHEEEIQTGLYYFAKYFRSLWD